MKPCSYREGHVERTRKTNNRPRSGDRRRARCRLETLEDRQLLSWASVPPDYITPPVGSPPSTYVYPEALSAPGDAQGTNVNNQGEIDFYHFTAPKTGTYLFDAASPGHDLDTVIAVYDAA